MDKPAAAPATVPTHWERGDPIADALHFLRMSGVVYCCSELTAPWGFHMPAMEDCLMFHVVTSGSCHLVEPGGATHLLKAGDFALVPRGAGHGVVSRPGQPTPSLFELPRTAVSDWFELLEHGGGGEAATLVCGAVRFDDPAVRLLLSALPGVIVLATADTPDLAWFHSTVRFLAEEARGRRPGSETVITRLADILVIQALRAWIDRDPQARSGWLGALRDKQIGRAIVMIHRDPAQAWTIETLAQAVGLSRSAFAARFSELVGQPVVEYLTQWRIALATTRLRQGGTSIAEIGFDVGYGSEAAFSRAFKRVTGVTPGSIRQTS
ncbi:AraC-like DNA-binding protein [Pelomonas saccharophila]|uniref:AraC-like DNA-binding protein n=1 Tax=Roseateles saccharophilus TaxID=304 RepID=A0ABU1YHA2_ROSSA|nr:AraC family transcriptional regulator [Roseateles saccharophilus]MDR7268232.1 AraC-like DNA-binding protein [Roseateles saccharophilus]